VGIAPAQLHRFCMTGRRNAHTVGSIDSVGKIAQVACQTTDDAARDFAHPT